MEMRLHLPRYVWMNAGKQCLHMLTGRVPFKLCAHNYECRDCAYDQLLDAYDQLLGQEDLPNHSRCSG